MSDSVINVLLELAKQVGMSAALGKHPSSKKGRQIRRIQSKGVGGMYPTNTGDLKIKPPSPFNVPKGVPRNVASLISWDVVKLDLTSSTSASAISENNDSFSLNNHPQNAAWTSLYDQWCIPQVSVTYISGLSPGATVAPSILYTALDFDNNGNLGSVSAIQDFASCEEVVFANGAMKTRTVRPMSKAPSTASSNVSVGTDLQRTWHDSGAPGVQHYGVRSIAGIAGGPYPITRSICIWFAFRNQI